MKGPKAFGEFFKKMRMKRGLTLRRFCQKWGFDPGNISKLERGLLPPPASREKLGKYAKCLGLRRGTDEWIEFFDLAAACRGRIPEVILSKDELVARLPLVFRTLRGRKVSEKQLRKLIAKIREA